MDKINNAKDQVVGRAKEEFGNATNNDELELQGKIQSSTADAKKTVSEIKEKAAVGLNKVIDKKVDIDDACIPALILAAAILFISWVSAMLISKRGKRR